MTFKYRHLADKLISDINANRLQAGQRMPSIRALSQQYKISITTALKTYEQLEAEGYLISRPQAGFFVRPRPKQLGELSLPAFRPVVGSVDNEALLYEIQSAANDPHRIGLGTVMIAPELLPLAALQRSLQRTLRNRPLVASTYCPPSGEPELCAALSHHFGEDGIHLPAHELHITNGCMSALSLAISATTQPGDNIAIPSPCFSGQLQLLASLGRNVVEIPSAASGLDMDALAQSMASGQVQACLVTANFQNPLGYCLTSAQKQQLATLASRYQCPIVEDDVFGECGYHPQRPLPIKSWDQTGDVLWCGSFSKTLAPGYRVGWCGPGRYAPAFSRLHLSQSLAVNSPLQLALADFVHSGEYRRHLKRLRIDLARQVDALRCYVEAQFPPGCTVTHPQGGLALWVQLPEGCNGMQLYEDAKMHGINVVPGAVFSARELYHNAVRLNAGNPWDEKIKDAVDVLADLIKRQVHSIDEGEC
ncbi:PLP-dependent aminotransferase family protein [Leeia sp. TBRC 13508]|uniref:Putative 8-amino-7-oxononanoate synthase n=1 Tax=Leeia speluncae TaxID=2884804 RepID=A0ABS8D9V2_9NEIS|nr:PLP-dependent aminotransferase family protein [Leeia speluncae]MCB6184907.1 PLP-dependent aminotransferase family protein [Leeia speluncae]